MRTFKSGAMRDDDGGKIDPEAALSPLVLQAYCEYMKRQRVQADGKLREDDDWQKGVPVAVYMKSLLRHVLEAWRTYRQKEDINDALFAIMFNTMGLLHERLKREKTKLIQTVPYSEWRRAGTKNRPYRIPPPIPNQAKPTAPPEERREWLEFHRNMTASFLPNEDDWRYFELKGLEDQADPQSDLKTS